MENRYKEFVESWKKLKVIDFKKWIKENQILDIDSYGFILNCKYEDDYETSTVTIGYFNTIDSVVDYLLQDIFVDYEDGCDVCRYNYYILGLDRQKRTSLQLVNENKLYNYMTILLDEFRDFFECGLEIGI